MLGGSLVMLLMSTTEVGLIKDIAWYMIGLEVFLYFALILSQPGIPDQILRKAATIQANSNGMSIQPDLTTSLLLNNGTDLNSRNDREPLQQLGENAQAGVGADFEAFGNPLL